MSLHPISEKIDTGSATGKLFYHILSAMNQWEREVISERTVTALSSKKSKNERISGHAPYGYTFDGDSIIEVDKEQEVIRIVQGLTSQKYTIEAIITHLDEHGYANRKGKKFGIPASYDLLATYKAQDMVERNFGFLKDDAIVNSLFLKSPARIEVLGLVLVLSLIVWRLMERTMRRSLQASGGAVEGWDKKATSRPTSLMIATMFLSMVVIRTGENRFLANGMSPRQRGYLDVLGVSPRVFTDPHVQYGTDPSQESKSWETTG